MLEGTALEAVLATAPLRYVSGYCFRFILDRHRGTAIEALGAYEVGGRFNPPGIAALYTSLSRETALAEATQRYEPGDPTVPMLMLSIKIDALALLDLTERAMIRALKTSQKELLARIRDMRVGTEPTQVLGRVTYASHRFGGILAPSRAIPSQKNVVVFPDRIGMSYTLHDPDQSVDTTHPQILEAMRILIEGQ